MLLHGDGSLQVVLGLVIEIADTLEGLGFGHLVFQLFVGHEYVCVWVHDALLDAEHARHQLCCLMLRFIVDLRVKVILPRDRLGWPTWAFLRLKENLPAVLIELAHLPLAELFYRDRLL